MTALVTALYAEGKTDERFLPIVIQRTAVHLISRRGDTIVDVSEPMLISPHESRSRDENMLAVARQTFGYHLLFVHADADAPSIDGALNDRFLPGITLIHQAQARGELVCTDVVPVIPVQMTEAWMLADQAVLLNIIGTTMPTHQLSIAERNQQIEAIANPKNRLIQLMAEALTNRPKRVRQRRSISELYEPLARQITLDKLAQLPSYQQLVADLSKALTALNFIR